VRWTAYRKTDVLDVGDVQRADEAVGVVPAGLDSAAADSQQHVPRLAKQPDTAPDLAAGCLPRHRRRR